MAAAVYLYRAACILPAILAISLSDTGGGGGRAVSSDYINATLPFVEAPAGHSLHFHPGPGIAGLVTTVLSQGGTYHAARAKEKREQWLEQLASVSELEESPLPPVLLAHELPASGAAWTVVPLLSYLAENYPQANWFFFANEETQVDFEALSMVLNDYDENEVWFLGHALKDQTMTIIHHYMDHTSKEAIRYPNFASGWALSGPALKRAADNTEKFVPNFNIDAQFELALFLKYMRIPSLQELHPEPIAASHDSGGYELTHIAELCMQPHLTPDCATAYILDIPECGELDQSKVFFGVKTCENYHTTRLPVVQGTWAKDAEGSIAYYSEVEDDQFNTTDIGVPNTERGHCGKMMAIISKFGSSSELQDRAWLVIADDDTLLSVPRLRRLLACYNSNDPILLGEAYGYNAEQAGGTTYITGGGSMVLSRAAVERIISSGIQCSVISSPDDMFLGGIAGQLGIHIIHSPLFHQSQPGTFHPDILHLQTPISFHRHKPSDPYIIYKDYLIDTDPDDEDTKTPPDSVPLKKTEL